MGQRDFLEGNNNATPQMKEIIGISLQNKPDFLIFTLFGLFTDEAAQSEEHA